MELIRESKGFPRYIQGNMYIKGRVSLNISPIGEIINYFGL